MAKQSRARSEAGMGGGVNHVHAGTYGSLRARTPGYAGAIAGTPERQKIEPHARRYKSDGTHCASSKHPGHRVGAKD